jgi:hypothetical protein
MAKNDVGTHTWGFAVMANEPLCVVVSPEPSRGGEFQIKWRQVGALGMVARLEAFDDGWGTLAMSGLVPEMATWRDGITLPEVVAHLEALGFENDTADTAKLSDEVIAKLIAAYAKAVKTNDAEAAVAAVGYDDVGDGEIVYELLEHGAHQDIIPTGVEYDAVSYRRLTAAVAAYREALRTKLSTPGATV